MLHGEPVNWEIFKIPPVQPIQYYSILKRKREFSQLIKQYDAQVHKHGYLHYCSIVPKSISSSLNDEYELLIVFFGDVPSTSFIGFRVNVNRETIIHESNSLLLFMKQSKKTGLYVVNNNCIYVQCGKDAWEIFYHLYGMYLKKYVLTVIGTQFFNHFVYQLCFQNEKQLLNMLFRGSKVIRVSKMSIYYRIHRKRKISVTDLIQMTLNMPESKRCVVSFDSKDSDIVDKNIYTAVGSKIHVSKLVINKFKKHHDSLADNRYNEEIPHDNVSSPILNFYSKFLSPEFKTHKEDIENKQLIANSSVQKRKFEKSENEVQRDSFFSKFSKISDSDCLKEENYWEQYVGLKPYPLKSYSSLLPSKSIIPDLFDNSKSFHEIDSLSNLYCNNFLSTVHSSKSPSVFLGGKCRSSLTVEETCDIYDVQNPKRDYNFDSNSISAHCFRKKKLKNNCKKKTYATNDSLKFRPNKQMHCQENISLQSLYFSKSASAVSPSKYIDLGEANATHAGEIFTTAAGKRINISNIAMLAAQKFIQDMFQDETHQKLNRDAHCSPVENKQLIKVPALKKNSVICCTARNSKDDEIPLEEIDSKNTSDDYGLGVSYDKDDVSFHTAAGKMINVSKAAMEAAHKLVQNAFENEDIIMPSTSDASSNTHKKKQTSKYIVGPPKKLQMEDNETMNKTLVEKFFQDAVLDEKVSEEIAESSKDKHFKKVSVSKKSNELTTCKVRKSLGGRRSLRFYSHT